ncbi:MAG: transposase [Firmicutes bacterium]|nr:transposase [Alicyclobacillaceae bacterium]MCL6498101.1 transposase [Bacillota bacterium]
MDVAEGWHYVQWLRPDGRPQGRPIRVADSREGVARSLAHRPPAEVVIGLESTGVWGHPLAHWLAQQPGVTVVLVNPARVHRAQARDDNTPTTRDPNDAGVIARWVAPGRWLGWSCRDAVSAELRMLAIVPQQPRAEVTRWETRIHAWYAQYFPEFPTVYKDWRGKAAQGGLRPEPLPADCVAQGVVTLAAGMLAPTRHRVGRKRATAWVAVAAQSIGVTPGAQAARYHLQAYLRGWRGARAMLARTQARQRELVTQRGDGDVLLSLPGFGLVVVATLPGWLGDLPRFADPRQALKMAGLNLTQQRSGHPRGAAHSSKRGLLPSSVRRIKPPSWPLPKMRCGGGGISVDVSGRISRCRGRRRWSRWPVNSYGGRGRVHGSAPRTWPTAAPTPGGWRADSAGVGSAGGEAGCSLLLGLRRPE